MILIRLFLIFMGLSTGLGFSDGGLIIREAYGNFSFLGIQADRIYIFTGEKFHVFDLKDGKPLRTFGQIGQGPGEYAGYFTFPIFAPEGIVINNMGKCIQYSLDGEYLKAIQSNLRYEKLLPFGSRFVGRPFNIDPTATDKAVTVDLIDDSLKPIREIYRQEKNSRRVEKDGKMRLSLPSAMVDFVTDSGKIYVGDPTADISFSIYDVHGDLIRNIRRNAEKIKITEEEKKKYAGGVDSPLIRLESVIADYFPAYHFFLVEQGFIYVFTYHFKNDKREVLILNENSDEIKSVWLTRAAAAHSCVYGKKFFYIVEDDESGELVLHSETII